MKRKLQLYCLSLPILLLFTFCFVGCQDKEDIIVYRTSDNTKENFEWTLGFGRQEIPMPKDTSQPYYIAGYNSGWEPLGVYDLCNAQAVWIDAGADGILLIGVDCIALSTTTVQEIRSRLATLCKETGCSSVNVYATHDHASVDTLGLWGPTMVNGKNDEYMENVIQSAVDVATQAVANRTEGDLYFGSVETSKLMLRDSRNPQVYDPNLHQLRFEPYDSDKNGIRMYIYGAHAESLRGNNKFISRDYPGVMCDLIEKETNDYSMYMPGAIGGLIMTEELTLSGKPNLELTGQKLAEYALSIRKADETMIEPNLQYATSQITIPLDNTGFLFYKFLGILENEIKEGDSATGYVIESEMTALQLGDMLFALIPGEIFPELVWGGEYAEHNPTGKNPTPLDEIAKSYGYDQLLVIGLANDELGYIVPPSDFLVNEETPYLTRITDSSGEDHYEETNSVGPKCAIVIADTFNNLLHTLSS